MTESAKLPSSKIVNANGTTAARRNAYQSASVAYVSPTSRLRMWASSWRTIARKPSGSVAWRTTSPPVSPTE